MKVQIGISICTCLMLNGHSNPYIESTTVLSDYVKMTLKGCKLKLARTPEAGKFHCGRVRHLEIHARPACREYTHEK